MWRLRLRVARAVLLGAVVGGSLGWAVIVLIFGSASWAPVGVAALIGMITVRSLLLGEPMPPRR